MSENIVQKTWEQLHFVPDYSLPDYNEYWGNELNKCLSSEEYFYNNYLLVNGKKPEPVPEGYFNRIRKIKARRMPSRYVPRINPPVEILHYVHLKVKKANNVRRNNASMDFC